MKNGPEDAADPLLQRIRDCLRSLLAQLGDEVLSLKLRDELCGRRENIVP